jgi:hypothetical protein
MQLIDDIKRNNGLFLEIYIATAVFLSLPEVLMVLNKRYETNTIFLVIFFNFS